MLSVKYKEIDATIPEVPEKKFRITMTSEELDLLIDSLRGGLLDLVANSLANPLPNEKHHVQVGLNLLERLKKLRTRR